MRLETKATFVSLICMIIVISSVMLYRWSVLNGEVIEEGKRLVESNQRELGRLRQSIDEFGSKAQTLNSDPLLRKEYHSEQLVFQAEFARDGVENIEQVLNSTYKDDGIFELTRFSLKRHFSNQKDIPPQMSLIIEGNKRLEQRDE